MTNLFYETKIKTAEELVEGKRQPKKWWYWTQVIVGAIFGLFVIYLFILLASVL